MIPKNIKRVNIKAIPPQIIPKNCKSLFNVNCSETKKFKRLGIDYSKN